ncbi:MAG: CZB domain-containing protein [Thiobacillus sp.]|uniref:CZB domain-containing protein n=1 Tax=Thiobacillus sp. TaxID=924 RepID=UPI00168C353B|nr:CZB domain-containing protein [Thiobacillus sp.]QLQ02408.1 MAG: CZB domain-containing protein [Thiobacillus sp.]
MSIKRDIEYAIYIHGAWKTHFRNFLGGRAPMDMSVVGSTHACKLGHWLDNEARRMLSPDDHAEACRLHARFHEVAGGIVDNIKQKNFAVARVADPGRGLRPGQPRDGRLPAQDAHAAAGARQNRHRGEAGRLTASCLLPYDRHKKQGPPPLFSLVKPLISP